MKKNNTNFVEEWTVHPELNLLKNHQSELALKPRLMRLLDFLLQHRDEIVVKEALLEYVWEGRMVTENLLTKSVSELRQVLKDHFEEAVQIETIRNVGYRLQINEQVPEESTSEPKTSMSSPKKFPLGNWWRYGLLVGIGLLGLLAFVEWSNPHEKSWSLKHHKITSLPGLEMTPAVSPDGKNIAFSWRQKEEVFSQIYVRALKTNTPRKLSSSEQTEYSPAWSPDGQYLVFFRQSKGDVLELIKSSVVGIEEINLARLDFVSADHLRWSPNGKYLLFEARHEQGNSRALYAFMLASRQLKQLTQPPPGIYGDIFPTFTDIPDQIAFVRAEFGESIFSNAAPAHGRVMQMDISGGDLRPLADMHKEINSFLYQPGMDRYLCWITEQLGEYTIVSIDREGQQKIIGQTGIGLPRNAAVMKGDQICYEYWLSNVDIQVFSIAERPNKVYPREVYLQSTSWDWGLDFAAKAPQVAFLSQRTGYSEIWLMETKIPQNIRQVTHLESPLLKSLALSPDGQQIVFNSVRKNQANLFLIQSNGEQLQQLTSGPGDVAAPEWSADGQSIYYSSNNTGDWQLYEHSLVTHQSAQLTTKGGFRALPAPGNSSLLYFVKYQEDGLWQYDLTTNTAKAIAPLEELHNSFNWIVTDQGLYYLRWEKGLCYLDYYDFETAENVSVLTLENMLAGIPSLAISPDFQSLFLAQGSGLNTDILGLEFCEE